MNTTPPAPNQQTTPAARQPSVNIDYINFFIEAVVSTFNSMIGATPVRTKILMKGDDDGIAMYGVSGIIGLAGEASGSVVLTFNEDTAKNVVGKLTGATYTELSADVVDGVGDRAVRHREHHHARTPPDHAPTLEARRETDRAPEGRRSAGATGARRNESGAEVASS